MNYATRPVLLLVLLAATANPTPRLAAGGFSAVGIEAARAQFFSDYFADQLNATGAVRVITQSEMAAMLGAERQRQLLGCGTEGASCLAELAGALDAAGVIIGSVAKVGDELAAQVKVIGPDGKLLGLYSKRVRTEPQVLDFLSESAKDLANKLGGPTAKTSSKAWVVPVVIGGALLAASIVCYVLAGSTWSRMRAGDPPYESYDQLVAARSGAQTQNLLGIVFLGIGLAAIAGGAIIGFTGVFD